MATAKKKPAAKRTAKKAVKYAAKTQNAAAHAATRGVKEATYKGAEWVNKSANEWQKGANEWAKQSAKLYKMPFSQSDANDVAKTAAAHVKSATENFTKMGSDWMAQMFDQSKKSGLSADAFNPTSFFKQMPNLQAQMPKMPNFDPSAAQEKIASFARESAEQLAKSTGNANRALNEAMELSRENTQAAVEVTNVAMSVSKELGAELISYLNKLFSQNVELSKQVLSCRTLNDMFDLANRVMKINLDGFFSESVKVSEMVFQCATDVSEPLNDRVSETTERLTKAMAA